LTVAALAALYLVPLVLIGLLGIVVGAVYAGVRLATRRSKNHAR
jgi:hypothetical protein